MRYRSLHLSDSCKIPSTDETNRARVQDGARDRPKGEARDGDRHSEIQVKMKVRIELDVQVQDRDRSDKIALSDK